MFISLKSSKWVWTSLCSCLILENNYLDFFLCLLFQIPLSAALLKASTFRKSWKNPRALLIIMRKRKKRHGTHSAMGVDTIPQSRQLANKQAADSCKYSYSFKFLCCMWCFRIDLQAEIENQEIINLLFSGKELPSPPHTHILTQSALQVHS